MASLLLPTTAPVPAPSNTFMSPNAGNALARLLAGLGAAATSYGSGSPQWGLQGAQALNDAQAQQRQQQENDLRDGLLRQQMAQQQQALDDAAAQKAGAQKAFGSLMIGDQSGSGTYDGQGRATTPKPSLLDSLSPVQAAAIKARGAYDPAGAVDQYWSVATAKPAAPVVNDGLQYDDKTGTWTPIPGYLEQKKAIAEAGRAPVQPPQMPAELQEYQMDQAALKAAGKPRQTFGEWKAGLSPKAVGITTLYGPDGKAKAVQDTDPSIPDLLASGYTTAAPIPTARDVTADEIKTLGLPEGTVAQRDEHNNLTIKSSPKDPPADIQEYLYAKGQGFQGDYMSYQASKKGQGISFTSPDGTKVEIGGSAVKPPNESQMAAASRGQLIQDGLDALEKLYDDPNISPLRVAGADTLDNFGPFGKLAAGNMQSDSEQQFAAAKASALEGLASSVTGAGVAKDQFTRYEQMLPALTDKPETRKAKLKAANNYLNTLLANAGAAAAPVQNSRDAAAQTGPVPPSFNDPGDPGLAALPKGAQFYSVGPDGTKTLRFKP